MRSHRTARRVPYERDGDERRATHPLLFDLQGLRRRQGRGAVVLVRCHAGRGTATPVSPGLEYATSLSPKPRCGLDRVWRRRPSQAACTTSAPLVRYDCRGHALLHRTGPARRSRGSHHGAIHERACRSPQRSIPGCLRGNRDVCPARRLPRLHQHALSSIRADSGRQRSV